MSRSQLMVYKRDPVKNFELTSFKNKDSKGLVLYQLLDHLDKNKGSDRQIVRIWRGSLSRVEDQVLKALQACGYAINEFSELDDIYYLREDIGVRLGLLLLAVKPLKKKRRIDELSDEIEQLTIEEVYYWYSRCVETDHCRRARRAFRILFSRE